MKDAMPDLKPCPFCGKTASENLFIGDKSEIHTIMRVSIGISYAVCCNNMKGSCGATSGFRSTPEEAIIVWNNRAVETLITGK